MPVIVAGTVDVNPEDREAFLENRSGPIRETREEAGCIEYSYSFDPLLPGRVHIFEIWESLEHLAAHVVIVRERNRTSPPPMEVLKRTAVRYEIVNSGPVGS